MSYCDKTLEMFLSKNILVTIQLEDLKLQICVDYRCTNQWLVVFIYYSGKYFPSDQLLKNQNMGGKYLLNFGCPIRYFYTFIYHIYILVSSKCMQFFKN